MIFARRIALPLIFFAAGLVLVQPGVSAPFQFEVTSSLAAARDEHTATLLSNGKVLVAGGFNDSGTLASAELYNPASGTWSATRQPQSPHEIITQRRCCLTARSCVTGGFNNDHALVSAELYDPASGTWSITGSLNTAR